MFSTGDTIVIDSDSDDDVVVVGPSEANVPVINSTGTLFDSLPPDDNVHVSDLLNNVVQLPTFPGFVPLFIEGSVDSPPIENVVEPIELPLSKPADSAPPEKRSPVGIITVKNPSLLLANNVLTNSPPKNPVTGSAKKGLSKCQGPVGSEESLTSLIPITRKDSFQGEVETVGWSNLTANKRSKGRMSLPDSQEKVSLINKPLDQWTALGGRPKSRMGLKGKSTILTKEAVNSEISTNTQMRISNPKESILRTKNHNSTRVSRVLFDDGLEVEKVKSLKDQVESSNLAIRTPSILDTLSQNQVIITGKTPPKNQAGEKTVVDAKPPANKPEKKGHKNKVFDRAKNLRNLLPEGTNSNWGLEEVLKRTINFIWELKKTDSELDYSEEAIVQDHVVLSRRYQSLLANLYKMCDTTVEPEAPKAPKNLKRAFSNSWASKDKENVPELKPPEEESPKEDEEPTPLSKAPTKIMDPEDCAEEFNRILALVNESVRSCLEPILLEKSEQNSNLKLEDFLSKSVQEIEPCSEVEEITDLRGELDNLRKVVSPDEVKPKENLSETKEVIDSCDRGKTVVTNDLEDESEASAPEVNENDYTKETILPSNDYSKEASTPSNDNLKEASTPVKVNSKEASTPSNDNLKEASTPGNVNLIKASTPSNDNLKEASTPGKVNSKEASTPSNDNSKEASTPTSDNSIKVSTSSSENSKEANAPSNDNSKEASTPSDENSKEASSPSSENSKEASSPNSGNSKVANTPSIDKSKDTWVLNISEEDDLLTVDDKFPEEPPPLCVISSFGTLEGYSVDPSLFDFEEDSENVDDTEKDELPLDMSKKTESKDDSANGVGEILTPRDFSDAPLNLKKYTNDSGVLDFSINGSDSVGQSVASNSEEVQSDILAEKEPMDLGCKSALDSSGVNNTCIDRPKEDMEEKINGNSILDGTSSEQGEALELTTKKDVASGESEQIKEPDTGIIDLSLGPTDLVEKENMNLVYEKSLPLENDSRKGCDKGGNDSADGGRDPQLGVDADKEISVQPSGKENVSEKDIKEADAPDESPRENKQRNDQTNVSENSAVETKETEDFTATSLKEPPPVSVTPNKLKKNDKTSININVAPRRSPRKRNAAEKRSVEKEPNVNSIGITPADDSKPVAVSPQGIESRQITDLPDQFVQKVNTVEDKAEERASPLNEDDLFDKFINDLENKESSDKLEEKRVTPLKEDKTEKVTSESDNKSNDRSKEKIVRKAQPHPVGKIDKKRLRSDSGNESSDSNKLKTVIKDDILSTKKAVAKKKDDCKNLKTKPVATPVERKATGKAETIVKKDSLAVKKPVNRQNLKKETSEKNQQKVETPKQAKVVGVNRTPKSNQQAPVKGSVSQDKMRGIKRGPLSEDKFDSGTNSLGLNKKRKPVEQKVSSEGQPKRQSDKLKESVTEKIVSLENLPPAAKRKLIQSGLLRKKVKVNKERTEMYDMERQKLYEGLKCLKFKRKSTDEKESDAKEVGKCKEGKEVKGSIDAAKDKTEKIGDRGVTGKSEGLTKKRESEVKSSEKGVSPVKGQSDAKPVDKSGSGLKKDNDLKTTKEVGTVGKDKSLLTQENSSTGDTKSTLVKNKALTKGDAEVKSRDEKPKETGKTEEVRSRDPPSWRNSNQRRDEVNPQRPRSRISEGDWYRGQRKDSYQRNSLESSQRYDYDSRRDRPPVWGHDVKSFDERRTCESRGFNERRTESRVHDERRTESRVYDERRTESRVYDERHPSDSRSFNERRPSDSRSFNERCSSDSRSFNERCSSDSRSFNERRVWGEANENQWSEQQRGVKTWNWNQNNGGEWQQLNEPDFRNSNRNQFSGFYSAYNDYVP